MAKIWVRVGGYVTVTEKEKEEILNGHESVLYDAIRNGFELDGETYIPADGNEGLNLDDDITFVF